jgi:hypothetical protein
MPEKIPQIPESQPEESIGEDPIESVSQLEEVTPEVPERIFEDKEVERINEIFGLNSEIAEKQKAVDLASGIEPGYKEKEQAALDQLKQDKKERLNLAVDKIEQDPELDSLVRFGDLKTIETHREKMQRVMYEKSGEQVTEQERQAFEEAQRKQNDFVEKLNLNQGISPTIADEIYEAFAHRKKVESAPEEEIEERKAA